MKRNQFVAPEKHSVDSLHECWSCFEKTLASLLADAFPKHLPAWQANRNLVCLSFPIPFISRKARKSRTARGASSDSETGESASLLASESGLEAQLGLPKHRPAHRSYPCISEPSVV